MIVLLTAAPLLVPRVAYGGVNRWTSGGPDVAGVSLVAIDPMNPAVVYASTVRGVFKSSNDGLSWSDPSNGELDGINVHSLAIDPVMPSTIYAGTPSGVFKSTDGGASWSDRLIAGAIYNLVIGSQKPAPFYAGDFDDVGYYPKPSELYKSTDDGTTWSRSDCSFSIDPGTLVIDPTQPSILYAGTDSGGGVRKSVDAGSTWFLPSPDLGPGVSALAIDPRDPSTLYAARYLGIYKSVNAASTWRLASGDLADVGVSALAIDPRNPSTLYAGTYGGVFRSTDGGASWHGFNTGLTTFVVSALAIDQTGTRLHASSRSGGVFDYQILSGALDLSVGRDGKTRLLRFDAGTGEMTLDSVDEVGVSFRSGPFGPYRGWTSRRTAAGSDGLTRVLWTNDNGSAALWLLGPQGNQASYRLGPVAGSTAVDVASIDGSTHLLWADTDGRISLWSIDNSGHISAGPSYGPYPGWTAVAIADGQDGLTRVLWNKIDGSAGLSFFGSESLVASYRFGPVAGWTAVDVAVGADGQARILWAHLDGRMALWRVDGAGNPTAQGPIYAPPPGFAASRIAAGLDGLTRVLWTGLDGAAVLWTMSTDNVFQKSIVLGPDLGGAIAGAWTGKFDSVDFVDCDSNTPAQASFEQNGTSVVGILDAPANGCGFIGVLFQGTLQGNALMGTLTGDRFQNGKAQGTLSGATLEISLESSCPGVLCIPGGQMHLHR